MIYMPMSLCKLGGISFTFVEYPESKMVGKLCGLVCVILFISPVFCAVFVDGRCGLLGGEA